MLLLQYPESASEETGPSSARFVGKFQQVTAPVMAKGLEDTAFYVYNRLLSLNEVGGDPALFGVPPDAAAPLQPGAADATGRGPCPPLSTHDTKRSEDVRARINVLSEMPDEWQQAVARWCRLERAAPATRSTTLRCPTATRSISSIRRCSAPGRWSRTARRIRPTSSSASRRTWSRRCTRPRCTRAGSTPTRSTTEAVRRFRRPHPRRQAQPARFSHDFRAFPAAHQPLRLAQLAVADAAEDRRRQGAGHLPGNGTVGLQPGGPGQPPARRLRPSPRTAVSGAGEGSRRALVGELLQRPQTTASNCT